MSSKVNIFLKIRRFDFEDKPQDEFQTIDLDPYSDFQNLKLQLQAFLNISDKDNKVIKIRNRDNCIVPLITILEPNSQENPYTVDVSNINYSTKNNANLLQDAYLDAIRQKFSSMEYRISEAEILMPQLQWRRQNHMEETVTSLSNRVAFLNRRIDELMPIQWKSKISSA